ncbi:Any1 protein [Martiniozyma asiatica (nom. inval.)]|nr:Any1 protein [Martiniozyma asiatica]
MAYIVLSDDFIPEFSTVVNFIMSFTPLLSYGSTVLSIRKKRSTQGFSIDICATMLIASTLRIFYYFNDPFEMTLLRQCFAMVFIQLILLHVALKYRYAVTFEKYHSNWQDIWDRFKTLNQQQMDESLEEYTAHSDKEIIQLLYAVKEFIFKSFLNNFLILTTCIIQVVKDTIRLFDYHFLRPFRFWQWRDATTYWKFLCGLIITLTIIQYIFNGNESFGIILGSISFLVESSLPLPQILLFHRIKNVENFKTILLLSWLGGDVTKISYLFYGTNNVGIIFIVAALFQMSLNLVIAYQFFYYKINPGRPLEEGSMFEMTDLPIAHINPPTNSLLTSSTSNIPTPKPFNNNHFHGRIHNTQSTNITKFENKFNEPERTSSYSSYSDNNNTLGNINNGQMKMTSKSSSLLTENDNNEKDEIEKANNESELVLSDDEFEDDDIPIADGVDERQLSERELEKKIDLELNGSFDDSLNSNSFERVSGSGNRGIESDDIKKVRSRANTIHEH